MPQPEPPRVEPPVVAEQEPALGSGGYSLAQPQMIGDFLGPNLTRRFFNVPLSGTLGNFMVIGGVFTGGFTSQKAVTDLIVSMPDVSRGPFKIAENESPRPVDRVFAYYSYFRVQGSANNIFALGSPPRQTRFYFDLHRETLGFERSFLDGNASFGLRVPFFQSSAGAPIAFSDASTFDLGSGISLVSIQDGVAFPNFGTSDIADLSVVFKYAVFNDRPSGNVLSTGVVVTLPTGPSYSSLTIDTLPTGGTAIVDGTEYHSTLIQPFVGYIWNLAAGIYLHGFHSAAFATSQSEVNYFFNDIGLGWWLYRATNGGTIRGLVPTLEVHGTRRCGTSAS